jgi:hypothetical protein
MDFLAASNAPGAAGGDCLEHCLLVLAVGWPDTSVPDQTAAAYRTGLRRLEASITAFRCAEPGGRAERAPGHGRHASLAPRCRDPARRLAAARSRRPGMSIRG